MKVLASYRYGDPAECVDRIRAEERRDAEHRKKREQRTATGRHATFTEEELKMIPKEWVR